MNIPARLPCFAFFCSLTTILSLAAEPALAADGYPWDGQITGNNVNVRSGAGTAYYPTQKLNDGAKVRVVGELKGWYEIVPPPGSFSYIDRAAVERHTSDLGNVTRAKSYVRAGSTISRRKSQTQITLTTGDPVVILGEADGFYKIRPPEGVVVYVSKPYVQRIGGAPVTTPTPVRNNQPIEVKKPIVVDAPVTANNRQPVRSTPINNEPIKVAPPTVDDPIRTTPPTVTPQPKTTKGSSTNTLVINSSNASSTIVESDPNPPVVATQQPTQPIASTVASNNADEPLVLNASNARTLNDPNPPVVNRNSNYDLAPAERRPPAELPDWANDNGSTSSSTTSTTRVTSTTTESSYQSPTASTSTTPIATNTASTRSSTSNNASGGRVRTQGETLYIDAQPMKLVEAPVVAANSTPVSNETARVDAYASTTETITRTEPTRTTNSTTVVNNEYITQTAPSDGSRLVREYYGNGATRPVTNTSSSTTTVADANNYDNGKTYESTTTTYESTGTPSNNTAYVTNSSSYTSTTNTTTVSDPFPVNNSASVNTIANRPPPEFNPPPIPISAEDGPWAAQLVAVELEMHDAFRMPIAQRPYEQLIQKYRNIAVQAEEPIPAQYAAIRVDQIQRFENIRRLTMRYEEDSSSINTFQSQMSQSRISTLQSSGNGYMAGGTRFDYVGILKKSWAFEPERIRYRIVDPQTDTTIIYLDIPSEVMADARPLLGKRVGVRISGQRFSAEARVPIADASAIAEIATGVLAEPIPNSNNVWNGPNTSAQRPNSSTTATNRGYDYGEAVVGTMTPVD